MLGVDVAGHNVQHQSHSIGLTGHKRGVIRVIRVIRVLRSIRAIRVIRVIRVTTRDDMHWHTI